MNQIAKDRLKKLLGEHEPPCISLYLPTHRQHPENQQDPIRYKNMLREMENSLRENYSTRDARALVKKFHDVSGDGTFWNHRTDGLAILCANNLFEVFDLQRKVEEQLVVGDRFHIKPLLQSLKSSDRYQVLCLTRREAKLYEGNRYVLDPVELEDFPSTLTEALGEEVTEPHLTVASYGKGAGGPHSAHGEPAMHHGQGGRKDEIEIDMNRFFRVIDRGILDHHSKVSGLPLVLAALPEYHTPFRKISHNRFLLERGIEVNPESLDLGALREAAWEVMEPHFRERQAKLVEEFQTARARDTGSDNLTKVAEAAAAGRVGTLLVEAEREVSGQLDASNGRVEIKKNSHPHGGDVLNDIAELVLEQKGEVIVLPAEEMPAKTGLAAIYRY
jgi:hypothetical protein